MSETVLIFLSIWMAIGVYVLGAWATRDFLQHHWYASPHRKKWIPSLMIGWPIAWPIAIALAPFYAAYRIFRS